MISETHLLCDFKKNYAISKTCRKSAKDMYSYAVKTIIYSKHDEIYVSYSQYATDSFDPHVKLLGSNYVFPNTSDTWSQEILIIRMGVVATHYIRF